LTERRLRSKAKGVPGPNYMRLALGIEKDHASDEDFVPYEAPGDEDGDEEFIDVVASPKSGDLYCVI